MGDVLSQSEIDALLAAMAAGDVIEEGSGADSEGENNTTSTVLNESLKFTSKDINILQYIHEEYTRIISSNVPKSLNLTVVLESVQEIRYEEFMRSIPYPSIVNVFKLNPLEGYLLFETSPELVSQVADIFCEGNENRKLEAAESSESDKAISMKVTKYFIEYLEMAWNKVLKVKSEIEYVETDPAKIKLFTNNEPVALASFSMSIGNINTFFNICIPYSSVEKYLNKLEISNTISNFQLGNNLDNTSLNIKVVLGNIQLSLGEIMNLQKGAILSTHERYKNKVNILVEERHCFSGEVGIIHNRKAVKIIDCLEKDV